jgi:hypothetical protein
MTGAAPQQNRRVLLPFGWFANPDPAALRAMMLRLTPFVEAAPSGLVIGPPVLKSTYRVHRLCDLSDLPALESRWESLFGIREPMYISDEQVAEFRAAADEHIRNRDFGWFAWRMMHLDEANGDAMDQGLAIHRDVLFPAFFEAYPGGRILAVTYERSTAVDGFLSVVNILNRARRVGFDFNRLLQGSGRDPMEWVGLHHIVYYPWYAVFLAFAVFFPHLHGFVASLQHRALLVYLLPTGERFNDAEPSDFGRTMPGLTMAKVSGVTDDTGDVRFRNNPFGQAKAYSVDVLESYTRAVVENTERMVHCFADLTRYPNQFDCDRDSHGNSIPLVDLGFARNTMLTLFVLLRRTVTNTFESDTFDRMMAFFEIVDFHASLITTDQSRAVDEFKRLLSRDYALGELTRKLQAYPGPIGTDLVLGLRNLRENASKAVVAGILHGCNGATVARPKRSKKGTLTVSNVSLDEYETELLRAARNTKHGYATTDADLLATHTGVIDEDFPDYALALMLGMLVDSNEYTLDR